MTLNLSFKGHSQTESLLRIFDTEKRLLLEFDSSSTAIGNTTQYYSLNKDVFNLPEYFNRKNKLADSLKRLNTVVDSLLPEKDTTTFLVSFLVDAGSQLIEYRTLYSKDFACLSALKREMKYDKERIKQLLQIPPLAVNA